MTAFRCWLCRDEGCGLCRDIEPAQSSGAATGLSDSPAGSSVDEAAPEPESEMA